ncbi:MAG: hypothetical protein ACJ762_11310 [Solirubrobacteraceae bacterium]
MAVKAQNKTVTTAPAILVTGNDFNGVAAMLRNNTATASVWVGGPDVAAGATPANAFEWKAADPPLTVDLIPGEDLWAVLATGGANQTVAVLATRQ